MPHDAPKPRRPRDVRHVPVLLPQVLEALDPGPGETLVDCTTGLGGHSAEILRRLGPTGRLICIDFDPANLERARAALQPLGDNYTLAHNNFAALPSVLAEAGIERVDGLLADLGVASPQIDDPA